MKLNCRIFAVAVLLFPGLLQANASVLDRLKVQLQDSLEPISTVIPGYKRLKSSSPKFAVAEFRTSNAELFNWSRSIAEILRYRIQYVPGSRMVMPDPFMTHSRANIYGVIDRPLLTSQNALQALHQTSGIETVLTGNVEQSGTVYLLNTELADTVSGNVITQREWQFRPDQLPTTIIDIVEWVYSSIGVELSAKELAYLGDENLLDVQAIEAFIAAYKVLQETSGPLKRDKINQLRQQHPGFVLFAVYAIRSLPEAFHQHGANENAALAKEILSLHPDNAGLLWESYRAVDVETLAPYDVSSHLDGLMSLIKANPHDHTIMMRFAQDLVLAGRSLEGVTVILEAVERWSDDFRLWWSLGWVLNQHAWHVRGNDYWDEVHERAQQRYKALIDYSNEAVDKALTINDQDPGLWILKLNVMGSQAGYSEQLIIAFDTAVELAPERQEIYESAIHYTVDQWGGTDSARSHIIELAKLHNPEEAWPDELLQRTLTNYGDTPRDFGQPVADNDFYRFTDNSSTWIVTVLLLVLLFLLIFYVRHSN